MPMRGFKLAWIKGALKPLARNDIVETVLPAFQPIPILLISRPIKRFLLFIRSEIAFVSILQIWRVDL